MAGPEELARHYQVTVYTPVSRRRKLNRCMKPSALLSKHFPVATILLLAALNANAVQKSLSETRDCPPPRAVYTEWAAGPRHYDDVHVIFRNARFSNWSPNTPLPDATSGPQTNSVTCTVELEVSTDDGTTFQSREAQARAIVTIGLSSSSGGTDGELYDTELLQLDISGGTLPAGVMLRESPTLQSTGQTTVQQVTGGYLISSFFDVFTEVSVDGGATWSTGSAGSPPQSSTLEFIGADPDQVVPFAGSTALFPPFNSEFVAIPDRPRTRLVFVSGSTGGSSQIIIKNIRERINSLENLLDLHTISTPTTAVLDSSVEMEISTDDGNTFQKTSAPAQVTITVAPCGDNSPTISERLFQTEMLQMDISGLPGGLMIRESPSLPSRGTTSLRVNPNDTWDIVVGNPRRIGSFFDVFPELSTDGGQTWIPADGPLHLELQSVGPEQPVSSLNFPPATGAFISETPWSGEFANGQVISNLVLRNFVGGVLPPTSIQQSADESLTCQVEFDLSQKNSGVSSTHYGANCPCNVRVRFAPTTVAPGHTQFYETEMLSVDISGGTLPAGLMLRESPSKASLGRAVLFSDSQGSTGGDFAIGSFFDIFPEISLDGGQTWSESVSGSATVGYTPHYPSPVPDAPQCPSNITVFASSSSGATVNYTVPELFGDCPFGHHLDCSPASGSTFPIGTATVTCTAWDDCGLTNTCSFTVTVVDIRTYPTVDWYFPSPSVLPAGGEYQNLSPARRYCDQNHNWQFANDRFYNFTVDTSPPVLTDSPQTDTFTCDVSLEMSKDGGQTYTSATAKARGTIQLNPTDSGNPGISQNYDTEMIQLDISGGTMPPGVILRESPSKASIGKLQKQISDNLSARISSFFDVFTEISFDGGQTFTRCPTYEPPMHIVLTPPTPNAIPEPTELLPPPCDAYVTSSNTLIKSPTTGDLEIVIKGMICKLPSQSLPPPDAGQNVDNSFEFDVRTDVSTDGGTTFQAVKTKGQCVCSIALPQSTTSTGAKLIKRIEIEVTKFDITDGSLPGGLMIRESPSLPSRGHTEIITQPDGTYRISSFFDIFPEVSLDAGQSWLPSSSGPIHMVLESQASQFSQNNSNAPAQTSGLIPRSQWIGMRSGPVIVRTFAIADFSSSFCNFDDPLGQPQSHTLTAQASGEISTDGGNTFQTFTTIPQLNVTSTKSVNVEHTIGRTSFFDTEMVSLDMSGGTLPSGVMVRESPSKASLGRTSIRHFFQNGDIPEESRISSFFDIWPELSVDGGQTWSAAAEPITVALNPDGITPVPDAPICPSNITTYATSTSGAVVDYTLMEFFGDCPFGHHLTSTPPSGSTFPIGTTIVTCSATDDCGLSNSCSFTVTVLDRAIYPIADWFFQQNSLRPTGGQFVALIDSAISYPDDRYLLGLKLYDCSEGITPPVLGSPPQSDTFTCGVEVRISDSLSSQQFQATAVGQIKWEKVDNTDGVSAEMLSLAISGGTLPARTMLRESPTLQSIGQTTVRPISGGYMISSFFDVFLELSVDGGQTWSAAQQPMHIELSHAMPAAIREPTELMPPPNDGYFSVSGTSSTFNGGAAGGVILSNWVCKLFSVTGQPTPVGESTQDMTMQLTVHVSTDGGNTWGTETAQAAVGMSLNASEITSGALKLIKRIEIEVTKCDVGLGNVGNLMIRESPTLPSRGQTEIRFDAADNDTVRMASFFDIFPEISMDGGQSWIPASVGPIRLELGSQAGESDSPEPTATAKSTQNALKAGFIGATAGHNVVIRKFTLSHFDNPYSSSDDAIGQPQTHTLTAQADGELSTDGGASFQAFTTQPHLDVTSTKSMNVEHTAGRIGFFDTEMLSLDINGGTLPAGVMLRESPSKASLGRTSIREVNTGVAEYHVSSFFDIWTEVSLDGGASWAALTDPFTVSLIPNYLSPNPDAPLCPSNITAYASSPSGAVVYYTELELFGDCPFGHHLDSSPASGTMFPIGTTTVTCTAWDDCGLTNTCTFTVTVLDSTLNPIVDWFFPQKFLPPSNSIYFGLNSVQFGSVTAGPVIVRNLQLSDFVGGAEPPVITDPPQADTFTCGAQFEISTDGGQTFISTAKFVNGRYVLKAGIPLTYDAEMTQLDFSSGSPSDGIMLRESPTLQSTGQTTVKPVKSGYMISSFFDVFIELSMDGGQTWTAAQQPMHLEMQKSAVHETPVSEPTALFPPPTDEYASSAMVTYGGGNGGSGGSVLLSSLHYKLFSVTGQPTPVGEGTNDNYFTVQTQVSFDGGNNWQQGSAKTRGIITVKPSSSCSACTSQYAALELTQFDIVGPDMPNGLMIRESPTLPSRGQFYVIHVQDGSYRTTSFFDIFTEISTDAGTTWIPADGPLHVALDGLAPEQPFSSPNLPPLKGKLQDTASPAFPPTSAYRTFPNGVVLSNIVAQNFDTSFATPRPGDPPQTNDVQFQVTGSLSLDGGNSFQPFHASGREKLKATTKTQGDFNLAIVCSTEILALDISGGNLPSLFKLRESPTLIKSGQTTIRPVNGAYRISSFLDIAAEISLDGGSTWTASSSEPITLVLTTPDCPTIVLSPTTLPYGQITAAYSQTLSATGGQSPYSFALTSGTLPDGLSLSPSGALSGSPTTAGSSTFTITVTDFNGCTSAQQFTIRTTPGCADTKPPVVVISTPKNNVPVPAGTVTAIGTASDDVAVDRVLVALDNDPLQEASLTYVGTTHKSATWSASLNAKGGKHTIIVVAQDSCGNVNRMVRFVFVSDPTQMVLTVNGAGSVTGPAKLVIGANTLNPGQVYTFNAVPSPNNLFSNIVLYQNDVPSIITSPKKVSFTMGSNTAITVNFVTNRFIAAAGLYSGLYMPTNSGDYTDSGPITFKLTKTGAFSGTLLLLGQKISFSGALGLDGTVTQWKWPTAAEALTPTAKIAFAPAGQCQTAGSLTSTSGWTAPFTANQAAFSSTRPCPLGGSNYTVIISGSGTADPSIPAGDGFASLRITPTGTASFAGKYADGTALSASIPLSSDLKIPFYQALYKNAASTPTTFSGSAIGWLTLDTDPKVVHSDSLYWSHGPVPNIPYSTGFSNTSSARAWLYVRPLTGIRVIDVPNMGIVLQDGGLASAMVITDATYGGTPAKITIPSASNPNKVRLTIAPTGLLTGSFVPDPALPPVSIFGAVMQASNAASGFFIGANSNGQKFSGYTTAQDQLKAAPRH